MLSLFPIRRLDKQIASSKARPVRFRSQ
ncbi:hypothetical protein CCACVL1_01252 [Corchorus capsularis]|uniref:Uncharacterized protein n=1 Tax=Corchorus capsularis TaxID=210143 RepID=A0A1R3KKU6_COCAP|nr:hypothetical protein CCACVL1_01252 [Corchorus capsularis]